MKAFRHNHSTGFERLPPFVSPEDSVEDQAAAWSDALRDGDADLRMRVAFEAWCAADPEHEKAFERIDHAYRIARAAGGSHALESMEARILRRVTRTRRRRQVLNASVGLVASVLVALAVVLDVSWQDVRDVPDRLRYALAGDTLYHTEVGERLAISLEDGSRMTLNTDSRAIVRFEDGVRGITLERGQALFEVARRPERPFVVTAGERSVTALGTTFDVHHSAERLEVTLIEGRVSVARANALADDRSAPPRKEHRVGSADAPGTGIGSEPSAHVLAPGEQLVAVAKTEPMVQQADIRRTISWRNGQVIFENDPLADAVAEINRYSKRRVVLADERLADMRLSGAFNTSNTRVFVDMVTLHFPVIIVESSDARIVLGYSGG